METKRRLLKGINFLLFFFILVLIGLSLYSYSPLDPPFGKAIGTIKHIHNKAGLIGAFISGFLVHFLGVGALILFIYLFISLLGYGASFIRIKWYKWIALFILLFTIIWTLSFPSFRDKVILFNIKGGGVLGFLIYKKMFFYLQKGGSILVILFLYLLSIYLLFAKKIVSFFEFIKTTSIEKEKQSEDQQEGKKNLTPKKEEEKSLSITQSEQFSDSSITQSIEKNKNSQQLDIKPNKIILPPINILNPLPDKDKKNHKDTEDFKNLGKKLEDALSDFGIQGEIVHINKGPVITVFEYKPAPGIKISKIASLNHDLALALKAHSVRIEAPIVGTDLIGIEVPNKNRKVVYLRSILESKEFQNSKSILPLALGATVLGGPKVVDLVKMPHLLVAGATGAGKSVCLNCLIISILFKRSPKEVKLLLVDPKRIELSSYSDLPHLIHPVITEMELAKSALDWAVNEMEKRYEAMAQLNVRNIESYNAKVLKEKELELEPMPYLVIIIDELADLMLTMGKEIEFNIVRLAQLARASGIHVILATQRPSVDVVTGLIKANFPSRIAFSVTSKHDSRTILDTIGAEYLLGRGDMLFKPTAGRIQRVHGAYLSDEEINRVIEFWKNNWEGPKVEVDFSSWKKEQEAQKLSEDMDDITEDPLYNKAVDFVVTQGKASISMIQRHLRIGFNRAARFVEQMEKDGIVGPQEGSKPREVLIKKSHPV